MDKYLYVHHNEYKPEDIWKILTENWNLPVPKLIISVTGSAIDFHDYDGFKTYSFFKKALCHAATTTGAWIITGKGITKMVGEAVNEYIPPGEQNEQIVTLGIMTFKTVFNRTFLQEDKGPSSATYDTEHVQKDAEGSPLDHNHSHFILFGTETEDIYGGKIELRTKFENYISTKSEPVPIVTLVVGGGVNTMATVHESVQHQIPVFVIEGTGGAADFISEGYKLTETSEKDPEKSDFLPNFDNKMKDHARKMFEQDGESEEDRKEILEKCVNDLKETLQCRNLVTFFILETPHDSKDLFKTIVSAWIKAKNLDVKSQLKLFVEWNCYKCASEQILEKKRQNWEATELYEPMMTALVENRVDFVKLFIECGVKLKKFLTIKNLHSLYHSLYKQKTEVFSLLLHDIRNAWVGNFFHRSIEPSENFPKLLSYVSFFIDLLLKNHSFCFYSGKKYLLHDEDNVNSDGSSASQTTKEEGQFENPEQHLFIWAVLFNRKEMAELFWKLGKDQLVAGLFASALLKSLSEEADNMGESELSKSLTEHAKFFERLSKELLSECYDVDKEVTYQLLLRKLPSWGNLTLLWIAETYKMMDFVEHRSCQKSLSSIWKGQMEPYTPELLIILCIFLPIFLPSIQFTSNDKPAIIIKNWICSKKVEGKYRCVIYGSPKTQNTKYRVTLFCIDKTINILSALMYFYSAPVTKFFINVLSYFVFLAIFSYFVLVDLRPVKEPQSPSKWEFIAFIWILTMIFEEIRQVCDHKFQTWLFNIWKQIDLEMHLIFIICFLLHLVQDNSGFIWARRIYSVILIVFYLRSMQFLLAAEKTGPKVIMIGEMLIDLWYFFYIFLVFVVSFGIAYHMNMYPNSPPSWTILKNVLLLPYFQMYSELFLDRIEGEETSGCTTNQTIWQEDLDQRCPEADWLSPVLLSVYLLMTNILLVNLLIAMFSYTFQTIQVKSNKVWSFYRLSLITEYRDCPILVPPFIILEHFFLIIRCMIYKICKTEEKQKGLPVLSQFEKEATKKYLSYTERQKLDKGVSKTEKHSVSVNTENNLLKETNEKIDKIISMLTDTK